MAAGRALGDGASVGQFARDAVGGLDRPFGDSAVCPLDPRIAGPRHVAQGGDERLVGAQHERKGQAAALCLVDRAASGCRAPVLRSQPQAQARTEARSWFPARRSCACRQCPTIPRRSPPRSRACRSSRRSARRRQRPVPFAASARMSDERAGSRTTSASASQRSGAAGSCVSMRIRQAMPERGEGKRTSASAFDRFIGHGNSIHARALRRGERGDENGAVGVVPLRSGSSGRWRRAIRRRGAGSRRTAIR